MKILIKLISLLFVVCNISYASEQLEYKIYRAGENGFSLASVLVMGKTDAVLIDAQFSKDDANKVVKQILKSKKELKTIYISHGDPDFYFGLPVIAKAFPKAKIFASKPTIDHIVATYQNKLETWGPKLGKNAPDFVILPEVLKGDTIKLEDKELKVVGLDSENPEKSYVWVPSIKAIFGGINLFDKEHIWMADSATQKDRLDWINVVKGMEKLNANIVIPTHSGEGSKNDKSVIEFTKNYLITYNDAVEKSKDSKELIDIMTKAYPSFAKDSISLTLGAKVSKGEMKW
jgi:glyoxylase-like metal-dependent hydrolase (beta-lactamase superfamily II)